MTQAVHTKNVVPVATATFLEDLKTFLQEEDAERFSDMFTGFAFAGGTHATGAGLTKAPDALTAYVSGRLISETGSIVYPDNDTGWVIAHKDIIGNVGTFTRVAGTHYLIDFASGSKPALPSDAIWLMEVTTSGGSVTVVTDLRARVPHVDVVDNQAALPAASRRGRFAYTRSENRIWFDSGSAWVGLIDDAELVAARDGEMNLSSRLDDFEVLVKLTNRTGASLAANDVVTPSEANDSSAILGNVQKSFRPFVVAHESIADLALGRFRVAGKTTVKVTGAVTRGRYLQKSATGLALEDTAVAIGSGQRPPQGALAVSLTSAAGPGLGTVTALLFGITYGAEDTTPGTYSVRGFIGKPNATTPDTKRDLQADVVVLRDSNNQIVVWHSVSAITNDILVAGPTANGRDQSGAFTAGSWVHFYFIWNGTTRATVSSASAPPTGPALPTGYTHWGYVDSVRLNATSILVKTRTLGSRAWHEARQLALSAGTASVETAVDLSAFVPPKASSVSIGALLASGTNATAQASDEGKIRVVSGSEFYALRTRPTNANSDGDEESAEFTAPNIGQQVFYLIVSNSGATVSLTLWVNGYGVPNGGE